MNAHAGDQVLHHRALAAGLYGSGLPALQELRQSSIAAYAAHGLPETRHEDWRYTDLSVLRTTSFQPRAGGTLAHERERAVLGYLLANIGAERMVFVNGAYAPQVSNLPSVPAGCTLTTLAAAAATHGALLATHLGSSFSAARHPLAALNTALHGDGMFLHLTRNQALTAPMHVACLSAAAETPTAVHPRLLLVLEAGASATLTLSFQGSGRLHINAVTEIVLGAGAALDLQVLQEDSAEGVHTELISARLEQSARLGVHVAALGGHSSRSEVLCQLAGDDASLSLTGLIIGAQKQTHDLTTLVRHTALRTTSQQVVKAVLDARSTGAYTGRVSVATGAQKTDAAQSCRTLLLSSEASMNTRPQLEIDADDVKCSHGATNGQLDAESLFYLRSRGIPLAAARILLTRAFADEVIDRFPLECVRSHLHGRVDGRIAPKDAVEVTA
ncbi:MAG: Fe-S cluster assembly protein SufD [Planctomycetes bacterium]|nr:Fe-S cluster assembly protein SufD [Planctomycetota bacterium]